MTTTTKTVLGIVVLAILLLIGLYAYKNKHMTMMNNSESSTGLPTAATDTSDAAIEQDTAAIDTQLKASNDDEAAIDQGIQTHSETQ